MTALRRPPVENGSPSVALDTTTRRDRRPSRDSVLRAGRLAGLEAVDLAARYGTPMYVYDLDLVERRGNELRRALPERVDIAYAVKANPALAIVSFVGSLGFGADVASGGELATAIRAGIPPERIVMTGPGKRNDELRAAVAARIRAITVESLGELERLERIASWCAGGVRVPVLLRMAVTERARLERVRLVGDDGAGKFGMDGGDLIIAARRAAASPQFQLLGLHAFGASNVLDADAIVGHAHETVAAARSMAEAAGIQPRLVDLGGGLGIPYEPLDATLDITRLGRGLEALLDEMSADPLLAGARLLMEPGRWLVGPAGVYLTRVVDRKSVGSEIVVILDGGVHHLLRPALVGQEQVMRTFPADGRLGGALGERCLPVTVAGPLCSGLDVFARHAVIGAPGTDDLVAVLDAGAYGFTESMPYFLSHPIPPEIAIRRGRDEVIRPRLEPRSWLDVQQVPDW